MLSVSTFTLVGVRADGTRSVLASRSNREAAENVLQRIGTHSEFSTFHLLLEGDWPPHAKKSLRAVTAL